MEVNNNNNNNKNVIWENKGILLGIILFMLKNYDKLINKRIIIDNDQQRIIIKQLFYDFNIKKKGTGFTINIKNNVRMDLVINNLNNLDNIYAKSVRILPWYDKDNPIIMYKHNEKKKYNIEKLKKKLEEFSNKKRWLFYDVINFIEKKTNMKNWDTYTEHKILKKYVKEYPEFTVEQVYEFICKILKNYGCDEKQIIHVPIKIPVHVPVQIPVLIPVQEPAKISEKTLGQDNELDKIIKDIKNTNDQVKIIGNEIDKLQQKGTLPEHDLDKLKKAFKNLSDPVKILEEEIFELQKKDYIEEQELEQLKKDHKDIKKPALIFEQEIFELQKKEDAPFQELEVLKKGIKNVSIGLPLPELNKCDCQEYKDLISALTNKIETINELLIEKNNIYI